jgi:hypothetical protein
MSAGSGFAELAAEGHPRLGALLLAASAEFGPIDRARARVTLDQMAARLHCWVEDGVEHSDAIAQLLAERRLRPARRVGPADARLDRVLERGEGHPTLIAAACVEAGQRAGLPLAPVGRESQVLIGVRPGPAGRPATIVDPAGTLEAAGAGLSWRCEHEVAFLALSELSRLFCLTGDVSSALKATELRGRLPISDGLREHLAFEAGALHALFN